MKRFFRFGRVKDVEHEVDDELAFHIDKQIEALVAGGMSPAAAREEALRRLGDLDVVREDLLEVDQRDAQRRSIVERLHDWRLDLRFGARALARAPGMAITVILLLALGIGTNTAIFGIVDRLLLRPPPLLVDPDHLYRIGVEGRWSNGQTYVRAIGPYLDIQDYGRLDAFSSVAGYTWASKSPFGADSSGQVLQSYVTDSYFKTLGTHAAIGRTLDATDANGPAVAVVSHGLWQSRLEGAETALGKAIIVDGRTYRVVGVMPAGFTGAEVNAADVWTLAEQSGLPADWFTERRMWMYSILARLKPGVSVRVAIAQVEAARAAVLTPAPKVPEVAHLVSIVPGRALMGEGNAQMRLSIMVAVVGILILFITIANVTHVLMVRAMAREREFAVRVALGAGWRRLMRLVLVESGLLALLGGSLALIVAVIAGSAFRDLLLPDYRWASAPVGLTGGLFAASLALVIALATGTIPVLFARRRDTVAALRTGVQGGRGWRAGLRIPLVVGQVAISIVLVGGASLFAISLARIGATDLGMDLRHILETPISLDSGPAWRQQLEVIEVAASRVPGVTGVTASQSAPLRGFTVFDVRAAPTDSPVGAISVSADGNFFAASGLRILRGRAFNSSDVLGTERVAVVNEALARKLWYGSSPIGRCVYTGDARTGVTCVRVIGVAAFSRIVGLREDKDESQFYVPLQQWSQPVQPHRGVELFVRTAGDPDIVLDQVRRAIEPIVPNHRVSFRSYNTLMKGEIRPWRVGLLLLGIAAVLAAVLTAVGLYAVMAFAVRQRYHELGVRRALGAQARHILRVVMARSFVMVGIGAAVGLAGLLYAGRFVGPLLFCTSSRDPLALIGPVVTLLAAAAIASVAPALAALRINPRDALQAD